MPAPNRKTGLKKSEQRKQMHVYTDKWVEMHNRITQLDHAHNYYRIEAKSFYEKWMCALEEIDKLRNNEKNKA